MTDSLQFITVYSGTEVEVILLKGLLENDNIEVIIQNDFQSGIMAGFGGGTPNTIRLKIHESNLERARPIIEEFISNQS